MDSTSWWKELKIHHCMGCGYREVWTAVILFTTYYNTFENGKERCQWVLFSENEDWSWKLEENDKYWKYQAIMNRIWTLLAWMAYWVRCRVNWEWKLCVGNQSCSGCFPPLPKIYLLYHCDSSGFSHDTLVECQQRPELTLVVLFAG